MLGKVSVDIYRIRILIYNYREYFIFIQAYFVAQGCVIFGSISYIVQLVRAMVTLVSVLAFQ